MRAGYALVGALALACSNTSTPIDAGTCVALHSWPEADALFRNDPQWIGADAAYSIDLGGARVLWLFGDTFIAKDAARSRGNAWFIRNSVAIQSGSYDPSSSAARAAFSWRTTSGAAASFFPESGADWFWPLSGVRLPSRLVLFLLEESQAGQGAFGFAAVRTKVVFVTNPDADPATWNVVDGNLPALSFPIAFGAAIVRDGAFVYAFGVAEPGDHSVYVARFDVSSLDAGDASSPLFWTGTTWSAPGATPPPTIFPSATTLDNPPTEMSVEKRADGTWRAVHSVGFGATRVAIRTSPAPEGPWSPPCNAFTPPEASRSDVIEYAAKAHPELGDGIVTYATNATDLATLATDMSVYFPRFAH